MNAISSVSDAAAQNPRPEHKRGCLFYVKRALLLVFLLPFAATALGFTYETIMQAGDAERYPPPGQMVDVGGYQMHIYCVGEGSPTLILESGAGGTSATYAALQGQLQEDTRVCTYDRAGMGWSESGPEARTVWQIALELHALLQNADIEPPYVLGGLSLGGLYVRAFAAEYPDETAGLVLLDTTYEGHLAGTQGIPSGVYIFLGRIGMFRLVSATGCPAWCSPEGAAAFGAQRGGATPWETYDSEWEAVLAPDEIALMIERFGQPGVLGDSPLVYIGSNQTGVPLEEADARYRAGVEEEENAMISLSSNHRSHISDSGHGLGDQNELILVAIRDVLTSAQTGEALAQ
jgi:pimeloyl-ACP methyl ester carboxylesterase